MLQGTALVFPSGIDVGDVLRVPKQPAEVLLSRGRVPVHAAPGHVADALLLGLPAHGRGDRLRDAADVLDAGEEHAGLGFLEREDLGDLYTESGQTLHGSFSAAAAVDRTIFKN